MPGTAETVPQPHSERSPLFEAQDLSRHFHSPTGPFAAVDRVDLSIARGEMITLIGRSGSGKTTLLHLLAGLDRPTAGKLLYEGEALHTRSEDELSTWRAENVGVVFQFFQLLPTLTVLENVLLPMDFVPAGRATARDSRRRHGMDLLDKMDIADQADKLPNALSGGQQQRVAIARAMVNQPSILVADEPTGNLDSQTAGQIIELFTDLRAEGVTLVVATHEPELEAVSHRLLRIEDGRLSEGDLAR